MRWDFKVVQQCARFLPAQSKGFVSAVTLRCSQCDVKRNRSVIGECMHKSVHKIPFLRSRCIKLRWAAFCALASVSVPIKCRACKSEFQVFFFPVPKSQKWSNFHSSRPLTSNLCFHSMCKSATTQLRLSALTDMNVCRPSLSSAHTKRYPSHFLHTLLDHFVFEVFFYCKNEERKMKLACPHKSSNGEGTSDTFAWKRKDANDGDWICPFAIPGARGHTMAGRPRVYKSLLILNTLITHRNTHRKIDSLPHSSPLHSRSLLRSHTRQRDSSNPHSKTILFGTQVYTNLTCSRAALLTNFIQNIHEQSCDVKPARTNVPRTSLPTQRCTLSLLRMIAHRPSNQKTGWSCTRKDLRNAHLTPCNVSYVPSSSFALLHSNTSSSILSKILPSREKPPQMLWIEIVDQRTQSVLHKSGLRIQRFELILFSSRTSLRIKFLPRHKNPESSLDALKWDDWDLQQEKMNKPFIGT